MSQETSDRLRGRIKELTGADALTPQEIASAAMPVRAFCGVYFLVKGGEVVYVGQSTNVFARVVIHAAYDLCDSFVFLPCAPTDLDELESLYIHLFCPRLNGSRDGQVERHAPIRLRDL
jgi:hypothetical protein